MWKKFKLWIKYLFSAEDNNGSVEESMVGFDMYQMPDDGKTYF